MLKKNDKVTIEKIAKKLGVATCTVSKALNNATDVSQETRKKVLEYTSSIGFNLKKKKFYCRFCVIIANSDKNDDEYSMINGFQGLAKKNSTSVVIESYSHSDNFDFNDYLSANKIDGAFIIGNIDKKFAKQLANAHYPAVIANSIVPVPNIFETDIDYARCVSDVVDYLYSLGHKKIGFLNFRDRGEKFGGYVAGMLSNNLPIDRENIVNVENNENESYSTAKNFASSCTAVICTSDVLAAGLIRGLTDMGIKVPDDISVTGFGDTKVAEYYNPKLTTVKIDYGLIGQTAYKMLTDMTCGVPGKRTLLNGEIIPRESAARIAEDRR